jgi:hypothetical protein
MIGGQMMTDHREGSNMSTNKAERTVPDAIEQAIRKHRAAVIQLTGDRITGVWTRQVERDAETAEQELRAAILAALEPERALREQIEAENEETRYQMYKIMRDENNTLRERAERLRAKIIDTYIDIYAALDFEEPEGLRPGDLADDNLTATSSAHEGRKTHE